MAKERIREIDWTQKWSAGAPMSQVFSNGHRVFLVYMVADFDEESIKEFKELGSERGLGQYLALVEFDAHTFRFGTANDEVFPGLPYYTQGIGGASIIEDSKWIEEIKRIHSIHPYYDESRWAKFNHYILLFKDNILEIIGTDFRIEIFKTSYEQIGQEIVRRMNADG